MFVDGVLVDEDWPPCAAEPLSGNPQVDEAWVRSVQSFDRSLTDAEVVDLNGGADKVALRRREILGTEQRSLQHWSPPGHNVWAGDAMPFFHEGRLHVFYLIDRRHSTSKFGAGAHAIAHASTTDLKNWEHHPLAKGIDATWLTCGTGTVLHHEGRFWLFYGMHTDRIVPFEATTEGRRVRHGDTWSTETEPFEIDGKAPMGTTVAWSEDGVHFEDSRRILHPAQNPSVFPDPATGTFHMLAGYRHDGFYTSNDLLQWTLDDSFLLPQERLAPKHNTGECQCLFEWNGWHYALGGRTGFWMSRERLGPYWDRTTESARQAIRSQVGEEPWPKPDNPRPGPVVEPRWDVYDGLWVPMVVPFHDRRLLVGYLTGPDFPWAGHLVFRELIQHEDGTLGTKWPEEMMPDLGPLIPARGATNQVVGSLEGFQPVLLSDLSKETHVHLRFVPGEGVGAFGLCIGDHHDTYGGCELRFEPAERVAQWNSALPGVPAERVPRIGEILAREPYRPIWDNPDPNLHFMGGDFAVEAIEGLDQPFTLELLVKYDPKSRSTIVDACIDGRRTMITRRPGLTPKALWVFAQRGTVEVQDLRVHPLQT
jgi:hypothetical protein